MFWAVPKKKRFDQDKFVDCCSQIDMQVSRSSNTLSNLMGADIIAQWFSQPDRPMHLLEVHGSDELLEFEFARLVYATLAYDAQLSDLDSVHLLADFQSLQPNFRKYWTSNK